MPIVDIEQRAKYPVIGKIRLGLKKQSKSGSEYPVTVPYFVLHDAPDIEKAYGKEPTELDVVFLSDDEEETIPYYYQFWAGGSRDKEGNMTGGKLQCKGDGREADHFAARDLTTRIVPKRACKASACPDWKNGKGQQQCKQMMTVKVWVPLANLNGVYEITTTSWKSIESFVAQVKMLKKALGRVSGIPLKVVRVPTATRFIDEKGVEKKGTQYIMRLLPNKDFWERSGPQIKADIQKYLEPGNQLMMTANTESILGNAPALEDHSGGETILEDGEIIDNAKKNSSEQIAEESEFAPLFEQLCSLKGAKNTPKVRLLTARKFEGQGDQKAKLKDYLVLEIKKLQAEAAKPAGATTAPPAANGNGKSAPETPPAVANGSDPFAPPVGSPQPQTQSAPPVVDNEGLI